jgi:hypothetical protein
MVVQGHIGCVASLKHDPVCLGKQSVGVSPKLHPAGIKLYEAPDAHGYKGA